MSLSFDAAIRWLKSAEFEDYYGDEAKQSVESAIRVLEAAAMFKREKRIGERPDAARQMELPL